MVNKRAAALSKCEITSPRHSGAFRGTSIGLDKDGYFVTTHRARSKSYPSLGAIPQKDRKFVASTG